MREKVMNASQKNEAAQKEFRRRVIRNIVIYLALALYTVFPISDRDHYFVYDETGVGGRYGIRMVSPSVDRRLPHFVYERSQHGERNTVSSDRFLQYHVAVDPSHRLRSCRFRIGGLRLCKV